MAYKTISRVQVKGLESRPGAIQAALEILGDKWSPLLISQLIKQPKTFGELELSLPGISPRTLSNRLKNLLAENIVSKGQYLAHPPRYSYGLTSKGKELQGIVTRMAKWGERYP